MNSHERPMCVQGDSALVLTTDPKPRLRWTVELHERFVDAVRQLGGADSHTEDHHESDGVKGLTLYHLKSHLQKFRLGKQPHKEFNDHSMKDSERASSLELQRNAASSSSGMMGRTMNEMQMEVNRRLHEQLEVQRHLQLRIEAQGKYMQTILEKACQTLAGENMAAAAAGGYNKPAMGPEISAMKDFGPPPPPAMNFSPLQDLNMYADGDQLELHHHAMERSTVDRHVFMPSINDNLLLGKKRPNPYSNENSSSGKSPLISWADDLRLQELGTASSSSCLDEHQIHQITPLSIDRGGDVDSVSDIYETKPMDLLLGDKKSEASTALDRPSSSQAAAAAERMNNSSVSGGGGIPQARSSPFG
ncbi:UNVERIFIED_CONTAM: Myb family transcription factor IPN2 [Sesamum latifolium]|uniref:Myb family transcription factor IPN2 n=1 Tax=Sesamum latifolium TaxID=2727402 RepID=A0AAW2TRR4_9LAMI